MHRSLWQNWNSACTASKCQHGFGKDAGAYLEGKPWLSGSAEVNAKPRKLGRHGRFSARTQL
uniref:Uncharacterized protein n=1 Tax=Anguilla anguilla TaxID=7936 RepID=A0A0E9PM82_ANGAN